ncbi:MAG: fructose-6-phosphate aldolase [Pseudomonadota bacterium]
MKFFIDTANLAEIKEAAAMGVLDGVTTNPSLMAKDNADRDTRIKEICALVPGPVSAEVVSLKNTAMVSEAKKLAKLAPNVVVKIPMTPEGIKACKTLSDAGVQVNVTLVFSSLQALLAAKAGAAYVSPFVGRLDDIATPGMGLVEEIVTIFGNYGFETEIIVASIRHPMHVLDAAMMGADIATMPLKVIQQIAKHPLTDIGLQAFLDDWKKSTQKKK